MLIFYRDDCSDEVYTNYCIASENIMFEANEKAIKIANDFNDGSCLKIIELSNCPFSCFRIANEKMKRDN